MFGDVETLGKHTRWSRLGPDCLDEEWTGERMRQACGTGRQTVKDRLMNQGVIAGLGNIALVEMGFRAKVHPHRLTNALTSVEWDQLAEAMNEHIGYVLQVEDGDEIHYQSEKKGTNPFLCYGRASQPCSWCETPFERTVHRGRPTFFCPTCQTLE